MDTPNSQPGCMDDLSIAVVSAASCAGARRRSLSVDKPTTAAPISGWRNASSRVL
jgi:hypothetical protein